MKKFISVVINCLLLQTGMAQKTEFLISINGNGSFFRGTSAASATTMFISDAPGAVPNVTADYYGKKPGVGTGAEIALERLSKKGFITGISVAFEVFKSRVDIVRVSSRNTTPASGKSILTHTFINLFPYIGKRFGGNKFAVELNLGLDFGFPLSAHEKGEAKTSDGTIFTTDIDHSAPSVDLRPRFQIKIQKNHFGIQTSYAIGQTEYFGYLIGADPEAYSNVFRLGIFHVL